MDVTGIESAAATIYYDSNSFNREEEKTQRHLYDTRLNIF